jgi:uroporphyrinogen III methyltransferase/synthase
MTQDQINSLLIDKARQGKRVVRLKGGDPYVFGRGGEEAEALVKAGIPFQTVPGVTSAIAAAAYAGIPVTHRNFTSSFTVVTGHERDDDAHRDPRAVERASDESAPIDWSALAKLPCLAFYMGVKALPRISGKLVANGMSPDTPAATIQWGTSPRQRTVVATISTLPQRVLEAGVGSPAITIVGRVVELRDTLNWFEKRPLFGQTIVVTRTRQQASELSMRLEDLGANVIEAPTIELFATDAPIPAGQFDWVIFTSANGAIATRDRLRATNRDVRVFGSARIAAIGDATASAVNEALGLRVDLCPESFVAEALADALESRGEVTGKRFLLLRADIARPILRQRLAEAGAAEVQDIPIYETRTASSLPDELLDALRTGRIHWITFTSSSTAENFVKLLPVGDYQKLASIRIASIGPVTTRTLESLGLKPAVEATTYNVPGLVQAILDAS